MKINSHPVIAHEIAHVTRRHAVRRNTRAGIGNIAGFVAAVLTGSGALYSASQAAMAHYISGYGREMELEADTYVCSDQVHPWT